MKKYIPPFLLLLGSTITGSCQSKSFDEKMKSLYKNTVQLVYVDSLDLNREVILLDTRAPKEYRVSHIPGAQLIDYDHFKKSDVKDIPKDAEVVVYCSVGYRSERIGEKLLKMGYKNVKNLYGGIFAWKNEGMEVVDKQNLPTDSVHTYDKNWSKWLYKGVKVYE